MNAPDGDRRRWVEALQAAGVPSPEADVRWLVEAAGERDLGTEAVDGWVARRADREPLQLILGEAWFRHVQLVCRPGVFVPRPETEIVAGLAIAATAAAWPEPLVLEPCTGTGAITCALVTEVPGVRVVAGDRDPLAVDLATHNVARALAGEAGHPVADGASASVVSSDLLDGFDPDLVGRVDVLVANPPYLPEGDRGSWDPEVHVDPDAALVGGPHGNEVVDALLAAATQWLVPGGTVVLELDPRLATDAADRALALGLVRVAIHPDLTGRDRALVASRPDATR